MADIVPLHPRWAKPKLTTKTSVHDERSAFHGQKAFRIIFHHAYERLGDTVVQARDGALLALTDLGTYDQARHQQRLAFPAPRPAG